VTLRVNLPMGAPRRLIPGVLTLLLLGVPAEAQDDPSGPIEAVRDPEVFVHLGRFRAGSDEGAIGSAPSYGTTVTIPISRGFAVDFDLQTSQVSRVRGANAFYETRRTLLIPSLFYRFGRRVVYGFVGGGIGAEFERSTSREDNVNPNFRPVDWREVSPGVFEVDGESTSRKTSFRGGVVVVPIPRMGVRGDVYMTGWHLGARIGVGFRFG
jgi:hypothetical protein